jgi:DNA-binding transcriptional MerR regulator
MTIKEFEQATKLPRTTIRHYEARGLLKPDSDPRGNGYRVYTLSHVERANSIKLAQRLGFSLKETSELIQAWESGSLGRREKRKALANKLATIESKMADLQQMHRYLSDILTWVDAGERGPKPGFDRKSKRAKA